MVNKKASTRLIWSKAIVSAWLHGARIHDWLGCRRVHIGATKNGNKAWNCKTSVHQISKASLIKQRWVLCVSGCEHVWLHHMWSCHVQLHQWGCVVVDQQCRESNGKVKIEGYMRVRRLITEYSYSGMNSTASQQWAISDAFISSMQPLMFLSVQSLTWNATVHYSRKSALS